MLLLTLLLGCRCGLPRAEVSGQAFVRCAQLEPPASGRWRAGELTLAVTGRSLAIEAHGDLRIVAFTGPVAGPLAVAHVAWLRKAHPQLVLVLGGLGETAEIASQSLTRLADLRVPTLFIAGGDDRAQVVEDAFARLDDAQRAHVVHASGLRSVRVGVQHFVIVPGAPLGRYALDAEACGFVEDDLVEVRAAAAEQGMTRPWLLSWHAPAGVGATARDRSELGSPELGRLGRELGSPGAVFAQPEGSPALAASPQRGTLVRRLGATGSLGADGSLLAPGYTSLTLTPRELRQQP